MIWFRLKPSRLLPPPHQLIEYVIGPLQITDIWAERCDGHVVYKYKFQKANLETQSWWAPQDSKHQPGISLAIHVEAATSASSWNKMQAAKDIEGEAESELKNI